MKKNQKPVRPEVAALQSQILAQQKMLMASKLHLAHLKSQDKKPFSETGFGRGFFRVVKAVTSPLAKVHANATMTLSDAQGVQAENLRQEATKILENALKVPNNTDNKAKKACVQCAKMVTVLESFLVRTGQRFESELKGINKDLREEIDRLRSPEATLAKVKLETQISDLLGAAAGNR